jgi:hypothetical protein
MGYLFGEPLNTVGQEISKKVNLHIGFPLKWVLVDSPLNLQGKKNLYELVFMMYKGQRIVQSGLEGLS